MKFDDKGITASNLLFFKRTLIPDTSRLEASIDALPVVKASRYSGKDIIKRVHDHKLPDPEIDFDLGMLDPIIRFSLDKKDRNFKEFEIRREDIPDLYEYLEKIVRAAAANFKVRVALEFKKRAKEVKNSGNHKKMGGQVFVLPDPQNKKKKFCQVLAPKGFISRYFYGAKNKSASVRRARDSMTLFLDQDGSIESFDYLKNFGGRVFNLIHCLGHEGAYKLNFGLDSGEKSNALTTLSQDSIAFMKERRGFKQVNFISPNTSFIHKYKDLKLNTIRLDDNSELLKSYTVLEPGTKDISELDPNSPENGIFWLPDSSEVFYGLKEYSSGSQIGASPFALFQLNGVESSFAPVDDKGNYEGSYSIDLPADSALLAINGTKKIKPISDSQIAETDITIRAIYKDGLKLCFPVSSQVNKNKIEAEINYPDQQTYKGEIKLAETLSALRLFENLDQGIARSGEGTLFDSFGKIVFKGKWQNDKPFEGRATRLLLPKYAKSEPNRFYTGKIANGELSDDEGKLTVAGRTHAEGKILEASRTYIGQFKNSALNGKATIYSRDGLVEGEFKDDLALEDKVGVRIYRDI